MSGITIASTGVYTSYTASAITTAPVDSYFSSVVLLVNGESLAAAASTGTFIDSSASALAITNTGNATQGTFSPYRQTPTVGYSADFSGGGSKAIVSTTGAAVAVDTSSSYTLEGFFYQNSQGGGTPGTGNPILCTSSSASATSNQRAWGFQSATTFFLTNRNSSTYVTVTLTQSLPLNAWFHFAFVATDSGGTSFNYKCYLNGVDVTSGTVTDSLSYASQTSYYVGIGCLTTNAAGTYNGYISNLRFTNGGAVYTSSFNPPKAPLSTTVTTGTVTLLTCNASTFVNAGTTTMTLTATTGGNLVSVSTLSPVASHSWSTLFNGTSDYLLLPTSPTGLNFGTSNYTVECWISLNAFPSGTNYWIFGDRSGNDTSPYLIVGATQLIWGGDTTNFCAYTYTTTTLSLGTWHHIAVVRSNTTSTGTKMYLDGVLVSTSSSANAGTSFSYASRQPGIGKNTGNTYFFNGYISNLRIVNGTALYSANFPPPVQPLTAVTNTALLTLQDSRFIDRGPNALTLTPTSAPKTSPFSPFEQTTTYSNSVLGGSVIVSSTSYVSTNAIVGVSTGDFTAETWVYPTTLAAAQSVFGNYFSASDTTWEVFLTITTGVPVFRGGATTFLTSSAGIAVNTWNHIAVARSGTTLSMFLNGTRVATATNSTNFSSNNSYYVGRTSAGGQPLAGYVSDTRVVAGTAIYTPSSTSITVPSAPLTAVAGTSMLLSYTNSGVINYATFNNLKASSSSAVSSTAQFKYGTSSVLIPTGSYIDCGAPLFPANGSFTVEFWFYPISSATSQCLVTQYAGTGRIDFRYNDATNNIVVDCPTAGGGFGTITSTLSGGYATGTWHHVALTRSIANVFTLWVNGVSQGTPATSTVSLDQTATTLIGSRSSDNRVVTNGYFDDIRITRGVARYTTSFTPPTAALATN